MPKALTAAIRNRRDNPSRQVSPKLADAIRAVIHDGMTLEEAAKHAGLSTFRVRQSFDERHVQKFIRDEKQMRLESARLTNISDLARIKQGNGAAAVSAIAMLEEMAAPAAQSAATIAATTPGVTINIINGMTGNSGQAIEGQHVQIDAQPTDAAQALDHPARSDETS